MADDNVGNDVGSDDGGDDRRRRPRDDNGAEKTKETELKPRKTVLKLSKMERKRPENEGQTAEK